MAATLCLTLAGSACSQQAAGGDGGVLDLARAPVDMTTSVPTFTVEAIDGCPSGGFQTVASVAGNKVAFATLDTTNMTATCMSMNGAQQVTSYDICYAESTGGAFNATKVTTAQYLSLTGVGMALDANGNPSIAFTGNAMGVAPATLRCGASNLLMVSAQNGQFGAPVAIATSSQSAALVPDMAANCIQNICNLGDATGYWPSIAFDPKGVPGVTFRDIHYGFATDDFAASDVEFAMGPQYSILTVDVARGGGSFLRLAFTPAGDPALVHYNGENKLADDGVWLNHEVMGVWHAQKLTPARVGEQLGFAINKAGLHALAYYDENMVRLEYLESRDGSTWTDVVDVDTDGITGQYPSLAFDDSGEPAIAYYRCNDYDPVNRNCDDSLDGLYLARRANGRWSTQSVVAQSGVFDGLYPALAFVGGKPVIAFQVRTYDPSSNTNTFEMDVARQQ